MSILLECDGFFVGDYKIPKFTLKNRCFYQMNLPFEYESAEDKDFLSIILNEQKNLMIHLRGSPPIYSGYTCRTNKGLLRFIKSPRAVKKLNDFFKADKNTIETLLVSNGIDKEIYWDEMVLFDRVFISLSLALKCSPIVFFDTAGLSPNSVNEILGYSLRASFEDKTIVHLDYPKHSVPGPQIKEFMTIVETVQQTKENTKSE